MEMKREREREKMSRKKCVWTAKIRSHQYILYAPRTVPSPDKIAVSHHQPALKLR